MQKLAELEVLFRSMDEKLRQVENERNAAVLDCEAKQRLLDQNAALPKEPLTDAVFEERISKLKVKSDA